MALNDIELPASLVVMLYPSSLVEGGVSHEVVSNDVIETPVKFSSLGGNQRNILIVVNDTQVPFLTEEDLKFLTEILSACKLNMGDVAIVNFKKNDHFTYQEILENFNSRIVLLFDLEPATFGLPMSFPSYQIQPFAGNSFLYSPALNIVAKNKEEKLKLWQSLKRLFNL